MTFHPVALSSGICNIKTEKFFNLDIFLFLSINNMSEKIVKDFDNESIITSTVIHRNGRKSLYMAGLIAAGGGFVIGFDTGAISGTMSLVPFMDRFLNQDAEYREALLVAIMLLTATIGGLSSGNICGKNKKAWSYL